MTTCPKCGHQTPSHNAKLRNLFAARVGLPAKINRRSADAAHNELATAMHAVNAEDVIDPRSAYTAPRRAVGFVEFKPTAQNIVDTLRAIEDITGEDPERWDEATGPMGGGM